MSNKKNKCYYCERLFSEDPLVIKTKDHIIPIIEGGCNAEVNKVPACSTCNTFKSGLMPHEFLEKVKRWLHNNKTYKDLTVIDMRMIVMKMQQLIENRVLKHGKGLYKKDYQPQKIEVMKTVFDSAKINARLDELSEQKHLMEAHIGVSEFTTRPEVKAGGLRFNNGKTRHDLVPPFAQEQYARVLTKGAEKYAERNWEKGMKWSNVLSSLERHLQAIKRGEDYDPETGLLHSAHVMCNAAFLTEYYKIFPQGDDRPHAYLQRPKIGLDIDEVICNWVDAWCEMYEFDTPSSWYFDGRIVEKFDNMRIKGILNPFYLGLRPKITPAEIPCEPHCYVTARPVDTAITEAWIRSNGFPVRPVYTVPAGTSKVDVIRASGIDIFVDDNFGNFQEINSAGICCYLFDAPHNQRY